MQCFLCSLILGLYLWDLSYVCNTQPCDQTVQCYLYLGILGLQLWDVGQLLGLGLDVASLVLGESDSSDPLETEQRKKKIEVVK